MKKIGITGQHGFIGNHLYQTLRLNSELYSLVDFDKSFFENEDQLDDFVNQCDVIVHLAAVNRHENENFLYETNVQLAQKLAESFARTNSKPHVIISSSTQEERDNLYGKSKKEAREVLAKWAKEQGAVFTGMIIPNVFGSFGKPNYNSFIATFCHQLTHGETPEILTDGNVRLIYVQELVDLIVKEINQGTTQNQFHIPPTSENKVSEVLRLLNHFKTTYFENGEIPTIKSSFEHNLFNTFRSYIDHKNRYPVKLTKNTDSRGSFVEVIRLGIGGQCSFSTTVPNITRGNHYHTRKIERFAVIKGKALIQLRRIGTDQIMNFELDGEEPSYVDMPIWFTHNIKNIGPEELYTIFWIDEPYNPEDADTYFEEV